MLASRLCARVLRCVSQCGRLRSVARRADGRDGKSVAATHALFICNQQRAHIGIRAEANTIRYVTVSNDGCRRRYRRRRRRRRHLPAVVPVFVYTYYLSSYLLLPVVVLAAGSLRRTTHATDIKLATGSTVSRRYQRSAMALCQGVSWRPCSLQPALTARSAGCHRPATSTPPKSVYRSTHR